MNADLPALYSRAVTAYQAGRFSEAMQLADECLSRDASHADVLHLRGLVALALDDLPGAERWLTLAVERAPGAGFFNSLSVAQSRMKAFDRAAQSARAGLAIARRDGSPHDVSIVLFNLGRTLQLDNRLEEARDAYREVLSIDPSHGGAHNNLGGVLNRLGFLDDAIAHFQRAIELQDGNLEAHSNLGHALLAAGRYRQAWPHFEHRWATFQDEAGRPEAQPPRLPIPQWCGERVENGGKRLLILNEQGLGDSLQFCRYIPMALERFAHVSFAGPRPLRRLFEQSFGARWPHFEFLEPAEVGDVRRWDRYAPLMSLPMAFDTEVDRVPGPIPYLYADCDEAAGWRARLDASGDPGAPRIGLAWAGGRFRPDVDARRSMRPEQIDALIAWPHARWVSVQKPESDAKRLLPRQRAQIVDWMDEVTDFADTAALVVALDLVICVDTSVAHLAAALGKPVWMLNRHLGCWRWMRGRDDTPWYPNMRIFNQAEAGNWEPVLKRVLIELEDARASGALKVLREA
jgi:tetratricopeptide (TPR) repeat protein